MGAFSKIPVGQLPFDSDIFHWVNRYPITLQAVNTTDVSFRVQVHVAPVPDASLLMRVPAIEWDVGVGERRIESLRGEGGAWGEYVWFHCIPLAAASIGNLDTVIVPSGVL